MQNGYIEMIREYNGLYHTLETDIGQYLESTLEIDLRSESAKTKKSAGMKLEASGFKTHRRDFSCGTSRGVI